MGKIFRVDGAERQDRPCTGINRGDSAYYNRGKELYMKRIGIGLVGYGGIGKIHTLGYRTIPLYYPNKLPEVRLAAVCTGHPETAESAARDGGFSAWYDTIEELISDDSVDVVDCSTPNNSHREIIAAALAAGKSVYCEKPLAVSGSEAREILKAAGTKSDRVGMTFNYRFIPAIMRAKALIAEGALGEIYNFRAEYLHTGYQDPNRPFSWRMRADLSGGGALLDLGSHVIDLARHLLGEFDSVLATTHTYITERPVAKGSSDTATVEVDDAAWFQTKMASGALGTVEVSRFATGTLDDLNLRIEGSRGALKFSLMDANWLYYFDATRKGGAYGGDAGWQRLETVQHYPDAVIPPARSIVGWPRAHAENQYQFLQAVTNGTKPSPGLIDGVRAQLVMDAVYESARAGRWESVAQE